MFIKKVFARCIFYQITQCMEDSVQVEVFDVLWVNQLFVSMVVGHQINVEWKLLERATCVL